MNIKYRLWIISIPIVIFALIGYCIKDYYSANVNQNITQIYYADNISAAQRKIISEFNKKYQDKIEVVPINLPFSKFTTNERKEILARSLRSRTERIDIFTVDLIWGPRFAKWAYDLSPYFNENFLKSLLMHTIESCKYDDKLISIPLYTDIGLMYFRKDLLEKMNFTKVEIDRIKQSVTWEEFLKYGQRIKKNGYPVYIYAADSFEGMICSFHEMLNIKQGDDIFEHEQVNLNVEPARIGLQLMVDLIHKYEYTPKEALNFDENKSKKYALKNDAVFIRGWPGFFKNIDDLGDMKSKVKYFEVAPLPHFANQENNAVYGGWNLMISKYSKHKKEALEFLKFTSSLKMQKILYLESGYLPIRKEIYSDSAFISANIDLNYYMELLKMGKHRPFKENYTKMSDIMSYYFHKALNGDISVDEALIMASKKINSKQVFIK